MGNLLTLAKWGPNTGRGDEPSPYVLPFVDDSTVKGDGMGPLKKSIRGLVVQLLWIDE